MSPSELFWIWISPGPSFPTTIQLILLDLLTHQLRLVRNPSQIFFTDGLFNMDNILASYTSEIPTISIPIPDLSAMSPVLDISTPYPPVNLFPEGTSIATAPAASILSQPLTEVSVFSALTLASDANPSFVNPSKLHISVDSKCIMFQDDFQRQEALEWVRQVLSSNFRLMNHLDFITVDGFTFIDLLISCERPDIIGV